ncbi:hypothetical protein H6F95_07810 [Cyanobacteria bacterium FACHB-471]|nr:hypothetical protein [Cyanobacteria bacterium FACHB-471]
MKIELGLTELVKNQMRQLAQEDRDDKQINLLEQAIRVIEQRVQEQMSECDLQFCFAAYWASVRKALKFPAKEIAELGEKLRQSRRLERISERQQITSANQVLFEVIEVGLQNAIEGLIAVPLPTVLELNLEGIRQNYLLEGDWFPFQVAVEKLQFVFDDDGTISVSTENFPEQLLLKARQVLLDLANQSYISLD